MEELNLGERKVLLETKYLSFCTVLVSVDNKTFDYYYASRQPRRQELKPDAVFVLAYNETDIVLTSQIRPPLGQRVIALPAGLIDEGESYMDAAIREMKEETNLDIKEVVNVSPIVAMSAGLTDETGIIVFAEIGTTRYIKYNSKDLLERGLEPFIVKRKYLDKWITDVSHKGFLFDSKCWLALQFIRLLGR